MSDPSPSAGRRHRRLVPRRCRSHRRRWRHRVRLLALIGLLLPCVAAGAFTPVEVTTQLPAVGQVAFSPDGEYLALVRYADRAGRIAVDDEGLALVATESGEEVFYWNGEVRRARFSPDGSELAVLDDFELRLAPVAQNLAMVGGLLSRKLDLNDDPAMQHDSGWNDVAWGGELLAVAGGSRGQEKLVLWRGASLERIVALEQAPWAIDLAPDDRALAATHPARPEEVSHEHWMQGAGRVELRDLAGERTPRNLPGVRGGVHRVQFDPQGRLLAADGKAVLVWAVATGEEVRRWEPNRGKAVFAWSGDGRHLAVGGEGGRLALLDVASGATLHRMDLGVAVHAVALSPDGRFLAVADGDGRARLWRLPAGWADAEAEAPPAAAAPPPAAPPPAPSRVDFTSVSEERRWQPEGGTRAAALDPAGARVAWVPWDQAATVVVDLGSGEVVVEVPAEPPHYRPQGLAFSPSGDRLAIAGMGAVDVYRLPGMDLQWRLELANPMGGRSAPAIAFDPGGAVLAATGGPTVQFFDLDSGDKLRTLTAGEFGIQQLVFGPEGTQLATYGADQKLQLWPVSDLQALDEGDARVLSQGKHVGAFAFSPDGATLAVADREGEIHLFDPRSGDSRGEIAYGEGWVTTVAFSPDGTQLLTGGGDGAVRVWDAASGELVATHPMADVAVFAALAEDGSTLLVRVHRGDVVALRPEGQ
ncbi:MAG TPA: WD40 repeat domain-containing protein [Thermoanaerobaculia bacterium]|nr:WD40 repeat domain-containing protein [Thermoanaerobaculia bacterium]